MNDLSIEALKQVNLAEFLTGQYGLAFQRRGGEYVCCSPFTRERDPSFFVRLVEGDWLFKDYSSDTGGSIFDFVQMKEKLAGFYEAVQLVRKLVGLPLCCLGQDQTMEAGVAATGEGASATERPYDVDALYDRLP